MPAATPYVARYRGPLYCWNMRDALGYAMTRSYRQEHFDQGLINATAPGTYSLVLHGPIVLQCVPDHQVDELHEQVLRYKGCFKDPVRVETGVTLTDRQVAGDEVLRLAVVSDDLRGGDGRSFKFAVRRSAHARALAQLIQDYAQARQQGEPGIFLRDVIASVLMHITEYPDASTRDRRPVLVKALRDACTLLDKYPGAPRVAQQIDFHPLAKSIAEVVDLTCLKVPLFRDCRGELYLEHHTDANECDLVAVVARHDWWDPASDRITAADATEHLQRWCDEQHLARPATPPVAFRGHKEGFSDSYLWLTLLDAAGRDIQDICHLRYEAGDLRAALASPAIATALREHLAQFPVPAPTVAPDPLLARFLRPRPPTRP